MPRVLIAGNAKETGQGTGTSSAFEALLTLLLAEKMGEPVVKEQVPAEHTAEIETIRSQIHQGLQAEVSAKPDKTAKA